MPRPQLEEILNRIHELQNQLEYELEQLLEEKRARFRYQLERGRVRFDEGVRELQERYRTGVWQYLRNARPVHILTAPVIYSVVFPLLLMDLVITLYQQVCFRAYGVPLVCRADYLVIDRQHLAYLNAIEKINCMYCGYANGLIEYIREIIARTEQYWCPIKHARRVTTRHSRVEYFSDYGDAGAYREQLIKLRQELRNERQDGASAE